MEKKKRSCLYFLSPISTNKKQINHLHMTAGCETETLVFAYRLHTFAHIFINPLSFFSKAPTQNANQMSAWPHIYTIDFFNNCAKQMQDHQLSSKPPQNNLIEFARRAVRLLPCCQRDETMKPYRTVEGCFIISELLFLMPQATV